MADVPQLRSFISTIYVKSEGTKNRGGRSASYKIDCRGIRDDSKTSTGATVCKMMVLHVGLT